MGRAIDLTGKEFGRLTVIEKRGSDKHGNAMWLCKCECGNEVIVRSSNLRNGNTVSCGCYNRDKIKEQWKDEEFRKKQNEKVKETFKELWKDEAFRNMQSNKLSERNKEKWKDEEYRNMQSNKMREMVKELWKDEDMKWRMSYKGGITPISDYLRHLPIVKQWLDDCKKQANYTCELTGKVGGELNTHHLKAFNTIILEAHELNNIEIHEIIGEYTQEELYKLEEYVVSYHQDNSNAVVLCKEMHDLFHKIYGYGNNTKEQYIEFKERKQRGDI